MGAKLLNVLVPSGEPWREQYHKHTGDQAPVCCACLSVRLCPLCLRACISSAAGLADPGVPDLKKLGVQRWLQVLAETVWVAFFLKQLVQ